MLNKQAPDIFFNLNNEDMDETAFNLAMIGIDQTIAEMNKVINNLNTLQG